MRDEILFNVVLTLEVQGDTHMEKKRMNKKVRSQKRKKRS